MEWMLLPQAVNTEWGAETSRRGCCQGKSCYSVFPIYSTNGPFQNLFHLNINGVAFLKSLFMTILFRAAPVINSTSKSCLLRLDLALQTPHLTLVYTLWCVGLSKWNVCCRHTHTKSAWIRNKPRFDTRLGRCSGDTGSYIIGSVME